MSELTQFWFNWIVQLFVALGTVGAVVVALFGEAFRASRVRLSAAIENHFGVYTPTQTVVIRSQPAPYGSHERGEARYYQLRVSNASRRFAAHRVDVWLLRVDDYGPNRPVKTWTGEIPLIWQHQAHLPGPRMIGHPANVDLVSVNNEPALCLQPQIAAFSLPSIFYAPCELLLTLQIRSDESISDEIRVRFEWDGKWAKDDEEMSTHLRWGIVD